jgi:hypothetical protein
MSTSSCVFSLFWPGVVSDGVRSGPSLFSIYFEPRNPRWSHGRALSPDRAVPSWTLRVFNPPGKKLRKDCPPQMPLQDTCAANYWYWSHSELTQVLFISKPTPLNLAPHPLRSALPPRSTLRPALTPPRLRTVPTPLGIHVCVYTQLACLIANGESFPIGVAQTRSTGRPGSCGDHVMAVRSGRQPQDTMAGSAG